VHKKGCARLNLRVDVAAQKHGSALLKVLSASKRSGALPSLASLSESGALPPTALAGGGGGGGGAVETQEYVTRSGELIGFLLLNLFGVYVGFEGSDVARIVADTPLTLLSWDAKSLLALANGAAGVALPNAWRMYALFALAVEIGKLQGARPHNHKV
jgi:hypothetical protein